jgi:hypothetical protein
MIIDDDDRVMIVYEMCGVFSVTTAPVL